MVDIAVESRKVSEFPTKASVVDADIVPILDSETSTASEKNKKISMAVLKAYCGGGDIDPELEARVKLLEGNADVITLEDLNDTTVYKEYSGYIANGALDSITASNTRKVIVVPVTAAQDLYIVPNVTSASAQLDGSITNIAFLKYFEDPRGATINMATSGWLSEDSLYKNGAIHLNQSYAAGDGQVAHIRVPSDAKYLLLNKRNTSSTTPRNNLPKEFLLAPHVTNWVAIGDSITDGATSYWGGDRTESLQKASCWATWVANINKWNLDNQGIGGSGYIMNPPNTVEASVKFTGDASGTSANLTVTVKEISNNEKVGLLGNNKVVNVTVSGNNTPFALDVTNDYINVTAATDASGNVTTTLGDLRTALLANDNFNTVYTVGTASDSSAILNALTNKKFTGGTNGMATTAYGKAYTLANSESFKDADIVTIALGINDWKGGRTLGNVYSKYTYKEVNFDPLSEDYYVPANVVESFRYTITKLQTANPTCKIVVITPLNCLGYYNNASQAKGTAYNYDVTKSAEENSTLGNVTPTFGVYDEGFAFTPALHNGVTVGGSTLKTSFEEFYTTIITLCQEYGIQYIDESHASAINKVNAPALLYDGIHPNADGHFALGKELARKIVACDSGYDAIQKTVRLTPTDGVVSLEVTPNRIFSISGAVTSLTVTYVTTSSYESEIQFTTGVGTPTISVPDGVKWINGAPTLEAETSYVIVFKNSYAVYGKVA